MVVSKQLIGESIYIRTIEKDDCTPTYVDWLNDPDVNQYLETRWDEQTMESIIEFVDFQRRNNHSILFAIILKEDNRHIGNIKIGPINEHHKHADVSYFIGEKSLWGRGIATEAINLICEFAFNELNLHKCEAGVYVEAIASWKALEKNGFKKEATFREHVISKGKYIDVYRYGLINSEFQKL